MSLDDLRRKIDELDGRIAGLLNERAGLAAGIGEAKRRAGLPVQDPAREDEVVARLRTMARGALSQDAIEKVYREVIAACSELQRTEDGAAAGG